MADPSPPRAQPQNRPHYLPFATKTYHKQPKTIRGIMVSGSQKDSESVQRLVERLSL